MRGERAAVACLLAMVIACADPLDGSGPRTPTVTDSAGVEIVTNPPGSLEDAEAWSLSPTPVADIGSGADPDVPLSRISAVVPLAAGRLAVAANRPPHVRILERDGTPVATLGGPGRGPGEFSTVTSVVALGPDSLAVWDQNRRRISVFTPDGGLVREVDLSERIPPSPMAAPGDRAVAAFTRLLPSSRGTMVVFGVGAFGPEEGVRRVAVPSYRISAEGGEIARYGPFPGEETFDFGAARGGTVPYPFGATAHGATVGDALVVGTADVPEIRIYGPAGALERIVRWPDRDRTLEGPFVSDWTGFVDSTLARMPPPERSAFGELLGGVPRPSRFPAYDDLLATPSGDVWIADYAGEHTSILPPRNAPVPTRDWLVIDREGALAARVRTPEGFQPHGVRDGLLWGVFRDSLEVESVRAYGIVRP